MRKRRNRGEWGMATNQSFFCRWNNFVGPRWSLSCPGCHLSKPKNWDFPVPVNTLPDQKRIICRQPVSWCQANSGLNHQNKADCWPQPIRCTQVLCSLLIVLYPLRASCLLVYFVCFIKCFIKCVCIIQIVVLHHFFFSTLWNISLFYISLEAWGEVFGNSLHPRSPQREPSGGWLREYKLWKRINYGKW